MDSFLYIGYITGPFGIKGEVKVLCESNHKEKIFKAGNNLYIDKKSYVIKSHKFHNNYELVLFENIDSIEKTNDILKKEVLVKKEELGLNKDEFLYVELLNCEIIEDEKRVGKVDEILYNKHYTYLKTNEIIIPMMDSYIEKIDVINKKVYVKNLKELK